MPSESHFSGSDEVSNWRIRCGTRRKCSPTSGRVLDAWCHIGVEGVTPRLNCIRNLLLSLSRRAAGFLTLTMMTAWTLPYELTQAVFQHSDISTLKHLSLVCKLFLLHARIEIHRQVHVSADNMSALSNIYSSIHRSSPTFKFRKAERGSFKV